MNSSLLTSFDHASQFRICQTSQIEGIIVDFDDVRHDRISWGPTE